MNFLQDAKNSSEIPKEVIEDIKECHRKFQKEHQENEKDENTCSNRTQKIEADYDKSDLRSKIVKSFIRWLASYKSLLFVIVVGWIILVGFFLKVVVKDVVTMKKEVQISEKNVDDEMESSNDVFQEPVAPIKESASDFYYKYYYNSRFDFEIYYPSFFFLLELPTNGDGCRFIRDEQTYLIAAGINNIFDETLEDKYKECKAKQPVYCRMKNDWLVVSDYTEDGRIYYEKTVLRNGAFLTATLYFPPEEEPLFSKIIPKIFTDFPGK